MKSFLSNRHLGAAAVIGLVAGLGATGFHFLSDRFGEAIFAWVDTQPLSLRLPLVILVPTCGLFLVGLVLQYYPSSAHGGVREVAEAIDDHEGAIPGDRIINVILSGLVLAFGGSVGPEGPMVQMGALIGSKVGALRRLSPDGMRTLVRAGAAAGVAAAFRSPAGGILLTAEVFGARFDRQLPAIGLAASIGYVTRIFLVGGEYPFALPFKPSPVPLAGLLLVTPLMGLLAAPAGHLFIWMLNGARRRFPKGIPLSARVALGGFLVGCIGIFYPQVMSAGYRVVERGLSGEISFQLFVVLLILKMVATSLTFGSGAVGGLFAPTLFMGAMFGGAFGYGFNWLYPAAVPEPGLFVLLGMIVMFGSIVKGYWSGLLLVADMSGCYHALLLPGIIAGGISYLLSWQLSDRSVFGMPLKE